MKAPCSTSDAAGTCPMYVCVVCYVSRVYWISGKEHNSDIISRVCVRVRLICNYCFNMFLVHKPTYVHNYYMYFNES